MEYNSKREAIRMPEYGRYVQRMVEYAISLPDRDERNKAASSIIHTMMRLAPEHKETLQGQQVYWDHLAIISNFQLDVDFPQGTITQERIQSKPPTFSYTTRQVRYRYYGHITIGMIQRVRQMPQGAERSALEYFIAVQMKRNYMTWNRDTVDDLKIFQDLYEISEGEIMLTPENCKININPNSIDRKGKQRVGKKQLGMTPPSKQRYINRK